MEAAIAGAGSHQIWVRLSVQPHRRQWLPSTGPGAFDTLLRIASAPAQPQPLFQPPWPLRLLRRRHSHSIALFSVRRWQRWRGRRRWRPQGTWSSPLQCWRHQLWLAEGPNCKVPVAFQCSRCFPHLRSRASYSSTARKVVGSERSTSQHCRMLRSLAS